MRTIRKAAILTAFFGVLRSILALGVAICIENFTNAAYSSDISLWIRVTFAAILYLLVYTAVYYLSQFFMNRYECIFKYKTKNDIFNAILKLDEAKLLSKAEGELLQVVGQNPSAVFSGRNAGVLKLIFNAASYVTAFILAVKYNFYLVLFALAFIALYTLVRKGINKSLDVKINAFFDTRAGKYQSITELVSGFSTIKEYKAEGRFIEKHFVTERKLGGLFRDVQIISNISMMVMLKAGEIMSLLILMLSGYMIVSGKGSLTIAAVLSLEEVITGVLNPISDTEAALLGMHQAKRPKEEIEALVNEGNEGASDYLVRNQLSSYDSYDLELKNVDFAYGDKAVLVSKSLTFESGLKYAITGESGSGKSTILRLIMKLIKPQKGQILLGGMDYSLLSFGDISEVIAYVPQEPFLFDDTIRNNILLSGDCDYEMVLRKSGAAGFIEKLPEKDETLLAGNDNISGGQKMRVAIARALAANRKILLLDEFSSSLDKETALEIEHELLALEGITVIVVTHKLAKEDYGKYHGVYRL